jgi:hypothetical protein
MWYKLNQAIGVIFLVSVLGGGAIYGLWSFMSGPPLLRQEGDESDNAYTRSMKRDFQRHMSELQEQQARTFEEATGLGRSALGQ